MCPEIARPSILERTEAANVGTGHSAMTLVYSLNRGKRNACNSCLLCCTSNLLSLATYFAEPAAAARD
jgi:hypothetical protein